jgi:hypothetical protein
VVWGVAVLAYVAAVLGRSSLAATGVTAAERFDVSSGVLSLLAVVQLAVYGALQVPAGVLVDRIGPRRVIAGGAVLVAVGQVVLALAAPFWLAVVGRMLVGAGDTVTFVSVVRLIPAWFPARRVPVYNQLAGILGQLGQAPRWSSAPAGRPRTSPRAGPRCSSRCWCSPWSATGPPGRPRHPHRRSRAGSGRRCASPGPARRRWRCSSGSSS